MKAEIIAVGTELLMGTSENTNALFITRKLALMGYEVHHQTVVGDNEQDIIDAVQIAVSRSRLTILTGGLGPTDDDITKESVAKAFNFQLVENPQVLADLKAYFERLKVTMTDNNMKQAKVIKGCEILKNKKGTAPGMYIEGKDRLIALLPGPPSEMEPMFDKELLPKLEKYDRQSIAVTSVRVFGIPESELEVLVKDLLYGTNPTAMLYCKTGEVHINIAARASTKADAKALVDKEVRALHDRIGDSVYCVDGSELHETVVKLLKETGIKISVAESCTAGLLASRITEVDGASQVFEYGMAAYADWVKQKSLSVDPALIRRYTAISSVTAAEMAKGAFENGQADIGVGITGLAGPTPGEYLDKPVGLVYIALADEQHVIVKKFNFNAGKGRSYVREMCVKNALDMVRRFVQGLPIEGARQFDDKVIADMDREKPKKKSSLAVQKTVISLVCAATLITSGYLAANEVKRRIDENVYDNLKMTFSESSVNGDEKTIDFESLYKTNSDTEGWLWSDNLTIDNVVVGKRSDGYYQTRDFNGNTSTLGCLYMDQETEASEDPDNLVIFGNSSDDNRMFGPLKRFTDANYLSANYLMNFATASERYTYQIISVFYANSNIQNGEVQSGYLKSNFDSPDEFKQFVVDAKIRSVVNVETPVVTGDKFLTLVTDVPDWEGARLVVVARRVTNEEGKTLLTTAFSKNAAPLYPEYYHTVNGTASLVNEQNERDRYMSWIAENERAAFGKGETDIVSGAVGEENEDSKIPDGEPAITVMMNDVEVTDTPMNIVSRMVAYDTDSAFTEEALKAQAIVSISMLKYSLETTGMPTVNGQTPSDAVKEAVGKVINQCLYYNNAPAYAPSFPISALKTNSYDEVFPASAGAFPYLVAVQSVYDYNVGGYEKVTNLTRDIVRTRIENYYDITLSEDTSNWIVVTEKTSAGYAKTVSVDGQLTVTGYEFALQCMSLRSAYFTLVWDGNTAGFTTRGYGDGIGMSREGANQYAKYHGWTCTSILEHYYPGTEIVTIEW